MSTLMERVKELETALEANLHARNQVEADSNLSPTGKAQIKAKMLKDAYAAAADESKAITTLANQAVQLAQTNYKRLYAQEQAANATVHGQMAQTEALVLGQTCQQYEGVDQAAQQAMESGDKAKLMALSTIALPLIIQRAIGVGPLAQRRSDLVTLLRRIDDALAAMTNPALNAARAELQRAEDEQYQVVQALQALNQRQATRPGVFGRGPLDQVSRGFFTVSQASGPVDAASMASFQEASRIISQ